MYYDEMVFTLEKDVNRDNTIMWINIEDTMQSDINQLQKDKHCMIPLIKFI